jgi:ABC-type phosphate/phosphonate transport system permease subunit
MKILTAIVKTIINMAFITFCAGIVAFFLTVFFPDNVVKAVEIFTNLLKGA